MMPSPLREIDPDQPKRLHTFGNPFKQDKKGMMIDEADKFIAGPQNKVKRPGEPNTPASLKRRHSMSPLLRRPQSLPVVTNHVGGKGPPCAAGSPSYLNLKGMPTNKDHEKIFSLLEEVQGPMEIQKYFIEFAIKEGARFKNRVLIQRLERTLEELEFSSLPNRVNQVNSR
eukprot:XP_027308654.1 integrator complex subunit 6-like [Anas platyrhynchos]